MVAAEFLEPGTKTPQTDVCAHVIQHCRQESKVLMMNAGTWGNNIRFMPPLIVNEEEINLALNAVGDALASV